MFLPVKPQRYYNHKMETLSREEILKVQFSRIKKMLEHVYHTNRFYREKYDKAGVHPDDIKTMEDFRRRIPFVTKQEFIEDQEENPPFGKRLGMSERKIVTTHMTSGTSGLGQEVYGQTRADMEYMGLWQYAIHWAGIERGEVTAMLIPLATHLGGSCTHFYSHIKVGTNFFALGIFDTDGKIKMMLRFKPSYFYTVPAYLTYMTNELKKRGIDPKKEMPNLKSIKVVAENFPIPWAEKMMDFWNCRLSEIYGSTQLLSIAGATCEKGVLYEGKRGVIHFLEHEVMTEVVDRETREPVKPGEEGELIVTPFSKEGSPVIRFLTGDKGRLMPHEMCECGRPFAGLESGTISRYDDMIKIKMVNVWPEAVTNIVFSKKGIRDYSAKVYLKKDGKEEADLLIDFESDTSEEHENRTMKELEYEIRSNVGIRMNILKAEGLISKGSEFKVRRWVDEREKGLLEQ